MYQYIALVHDHHKSEQESYSIIKKLLSSSQIDGEHQVVSSLDGVRQATRLATKNAKTLVAIGDDDCFNTLVDIIATSDTPELVAGYIPLSKHQTAATKLLGIRSERDAISTLTARKLHQFSMLSVDDGYFLSQLDLVVDSDQDSDKLIECVIDDQLTIKANSRRLLFTNLIDQVQSQQKNLLVEGFSQIDYKTNSHQPFIRLPYLKNKPLQQNQAIFRLLANEIKIKTNGQSFVDRVKADSTINIGQKIKPVKVIVKKHRTD